MKSRNDLFIKYFESIYASSNTLQKPEFERSAKEIELQFRRFLPKDKNIKILDVGSGAGHFLYYLTKNDYSNFMGIDISPDQVKFCKKNISQNVRLADAFQFLSSTSDSYDIVHSSDVIEHIPKKKVIDFLEMIYKSLKPGGAVLLKMPNMSNPFALDSRYRDFTHENGFTEKSIYQVLYIAGFRDIRINPSKVISDSSRGFLCKIFVSFFHFLINKMFWYQGFTAPRILSSRLIAVARKRG